MMFHATLLMKQLTIKENLYCVKKRSQNVGATFKFTS